jgi:hypothetical protein
MTAAPLISACPGTGHERANADYADGPLASLLAAMPTALPTTMTTTGPAPTAGNEDLIEEVIWVGNVGTRKYVLRTLDALDASTSPSTGSWSPSRRTSSTS